MTTVRELQSGIDHLIPQGRNVYGALNKALRVLYKRLMLHRSDKIIGEMDETTVAENEYVDLPDGFWGLVEAPYLPDTRRLLSPVTGRADKLYPAAGSPRQYEVKGQRLYLYPCTEGYNVKADCFIGPTLLEKPTDQVPFDGLFDDVLESALLEIFAAGSTGGQTAAVINQGVDEIIQAIPRRAPAEMPQPTGGWGEMNR